ncbi:MAG: extracellular solute-binding protein, partial [Sneathiella sp.]
MEILKATAIACVAFLSVNTFSFAETVKTTKSHGLSLAGPLKYGPDFKHLAYANPDAPKGGTLRRSARGGFDSLNPFIARGQAASGLPLTFETLMGQPYDSSSAEYGLIASSVEVAEDLSFVIYNLREEAKFHDGSQITAEDFIFSLSILKSEGAPQYRYYYANVIKAEALTPQRLKFTFSGPPNRELPQIIGQLPALSKKYFEDHEFSKTTLSPIMGSGPYKVKNLEANRFISYERVPDYWGANIPLNKGRYNFDTIRYDFYRDTSILLEAFKAGEYDFRAENSAKNWATGYNFPALKQGLVVKEEIISTSPAGQQAYVFNLRRAKFENPALREALTYAFDFEWLNKNIFYNQYKRTDSFFYNSIMAAKGEPSAEELKILEPYRDQIPSRVFGPAYAPPITDGSGRDRKGLRAAKSILEKAGFLIDGGKLIDPVSKQPVTIEFLIYDQNSLRILGPFIKNLKKLGVTANSRLVDTAQYTARVRNYDYDMITSGFGQSVSPGNEQRDFWSSAAAKRPGSRNTIGIENPVI